MTSLQLLDLKGKSVGEVNLGDTVFGIEPNSAVLFEALQRQLANARAGTAAAKTRAEVSGGGRKPWRQKGTGRARAGSIRSPLWAGGGVVFGPKPRDYSLSMPKKMRRLALKSALAARRDELVVVKDFNELKTPKTKEMFAALTALGLHDKKVLIVLDFACQACSLVKQAAGNIDGVKVVHVNDLNVKDLLDCQAVLTSESTLETINKIFAAAASKSKPAAAAKNKITKQPPGAKATSKAGPGKAADAQAATVPKKKASLKNNTRQTGKKSIDKQ